MLSQRSLGQILTMQFLTAVSPQSFSTPSWKIEAKYSTRVLTGNWLEERKMVRKEEVDRGLRGRPAREREELGHYYFQRAIGDCILRRWHCAIHRRVTFKQSSRSLLHLENLIAQVSIWLCLAVPYSVECF